MNNLKVISFLLHFAVVSAVLLKRPGQNIATSSELQEPRMTIKNTDMDDLIKSILWKKQTLIDGFYAVRQDVYTIRQVETHVRIVFSIVTSVCHPAMPQLTMEDLYGKRCPTQRITRMWICRADIYEKDEKSSKALPKLSADDVDPKKPQPIVPERQDVLLLITLYLLEVASNSNGYYDKLQQVLSAQQIGAAYEVQFAVAPSMCDSTMRLSLEELYSPMCPTQKVSSWKLCKGKLYRVINYKPHITCAGSITTGKHEQITVSQNDLYSRHLLMENQKLKKLLQMSLDAQRVKFENSPAIIDAIYKATGEGTILNVEFSIAPACDAEQSTHARPAAAHGCNPKSRRRQLCTGDFEMQKQILTRLNCAQFFKPDLTVQENIERKKGLSTEMTMKFIREYLLGPNFKWHKPYAPRLQSIDSFIAHDFYVQTEFTLALTRCKRSEAISVAQLYSNKCKASEKRSKYHCTGKFNPVRETAHEVKCDKVKEQLKEHSNRVE
ncbi:hypothetical protein M513_03290 [Trichuris suis]|uniref:Uncharacterized protein n=1 Tax=Trichuris suis TaxID=68888 RepID=A0A085MF55_9BILA|nr:hypothetical protein M513_03290 [Trichuris suis]